jgi:putative transposase
MLWQDNYRVYGVGKLWKAARRAGLDVGPDQTDPLMHAAGIEGATRSKRVKMTRPDPRPAPHLDLVKGEFTATAPNRVWVIRSDVRADLGGSRVCLLHHRRVLTDDRGVAVRLTHAHPDGPGRDRDGEVVSGAAITGDLHCHSHAGSQFTSIRYDEQLTEIDATPSIETINDSHDNALTETVNSYYQDRTRPRTATTRPLEDCRGRTRDASPRVAVTLRALFISPIIGVS